jgi:hypothetical protein
MANEKRGDLYDTNVAVLAPSEGHARAAGESYSDVILHLAAEGWRPLHLRDKIGIEAKLQSCPAPCGSREFCRSLRRTARRSLGTSTRKSTSFRPTRPRKNGGGDPNLSM